MLFQSIYSFLGVHLTNLLASMKLDFSVNKAYNNQSSLSKTDSPFDEKLLPRIYTITILRKRNYYKVIPRKFSC